MIRNKIGYLSFLYILSLISCTKPTKACFTYIAENASPHSVKFDASCSQSSSLFEWSFGDTTFSDVNSFDTVTHNYSYAGSYRVTLHVTRKDGSTIGKDHYDISHQITVP